MHQRQAGSYARRFQYGKQTIGPGNGIEKLLLDAPGIGMVPPEFDDLQGGELDTIDKLRAEPVPR